MSSTRKDWGVARRVLPHYFDVKIVEKGSARKDSGMSTKQTIFLEYDPSTNQYAPEIKNTSYFEYDRTTEKFIPALIVEDMVDMPKLQPPKPVISFSRDELPKEILEEANKLTKGIVFLETMWGNGITKLPEIGFFMNGMKWMYYLDIKMIGDYNDLVQRFEKIVLNYKPTGKIIEDLTNRHILLEIKANYANQVHMNANMNLGNVQEQLKKYKIPPTFDREEKEFNMKFYEIMVDDIGKMYPGQRVEFRPEDYEKINNWQEHELLLMSWDNLAIKELEIFVTEMKYICILLKNETDKIHLTSVSPGISDKELTGGIVLSLQSKVKELEEKIRKLENENKEQKAIIENQKADLKQWCADYKRRGHFLTWGDHESGKRYEREYSNEFIKYRKDIDDYFSGYDGNGNIVLLYPNDKVEVLPESIYERMKNQLSEGDADRLLTKKDEPNENKQPDQIIEITLTPMEKEVERIIFAFEDGTFKRSEIVEKCECTEPVVDSTIDKLKRKGKLSSLGGGYYKKS